MKIEDIEKNLFLEGDFIVSADYHVPYVHWPTFEWMIAVAKFFKIRNLIIAGDFLDEYAFSWVRGFDSSMRQKLFQQTFKNEIKKAKEIFEIFDKHFDKIIWVLGGHDSRIITLTKYEIDEDLLITLVTSFCKNVEVRKKIRCLPLNRVIVNKKWKIIHGATYSRIPLGKARSYWYKDPEYNTIMAHVHLGTFGFAPNGKNIICDLGVLCDEKKIPWTFIKETDHPRFVKGFGVIKDNEYYPFYEGLGNWIKFVKKK